MHLFLETLHNNQWYDKKRCSYMYFISEICQCSSVHHLPQKYWK